MAISVDWPAKIINVPRADMLLIQSSPSEIRELDLEVFRKTLRDLEDDEEGRAFPRTHDYDQPKSVGGVSLASVILIVNDYTITFEDGQYAVNLVGANSNAGDVVNVNQVSVRSANSAGLTYSKEVEDQSFADGRVFINTSIGLPGTQYPRGTTTSPVSNYTDAFAISASRNLPDRYLLKGVMVLSGEDISGIDVLGTTLPSDSITFNNATCNGGSFDTLMLTGACSGVYTARNCVLMNVSGFNGFLFGGAIGGTLSLASGEAHIVNAHAAASGTDTVTLNCAGADVDVFVPGWEGKMLMSNHSHPGAKTAIDAKAGEITIDASCTSGTIVVRGTVNVVDNSGAGCTVLVDAADQPTTGTRTLELSEADEELTPTQAIKRRRGTTDVLLTKNVTGSANWPASVKLED